MNTRRLVLPAAVVLMAGLLMGMSGMGAPSIRGQEPSPFKARLADSAGHEVSLSAVTIDGKAGLSASIGKGRVHIPFVNIARIEISGSLAVVTLQSGEQIAALTINAVSRLSGKTAYGTYQIALKDIDWTELTSTASDERP